MNPLYAGLMCTLLLIGTVAALFGCMSAARCRRRASCCDLSDHCFAGFCSSCQCCCLACRIAQRFRMRRLDGRRADTSVLSLFSLLLMLRGSRRQLSPFSIKESCDHLPCALCFAWENGQPCLKNLKMDELSHQLTGEALLNANVFWRAIKSQPIVTLENGQT